MVYFKTFTVEYKSDPKELHYIIRGEKKQYYEFDSRSKGPIRLINNNGNDIIIATSTSKLSLDFKLEFNNGSNPYELEFSMINDASGFKLKGNYSKVSIKWSGKIFFTKMPYKLVNNAQSNSTTAEVKIKDLRGYEVLLYPENIARKRLEEIAIGSASLVKNIHGDNLSTNIGVKGVSKNLCCIC